MIRVGVDASIDNILLKDFIGKVELVRIPAEPKGEIAIDFWVPSIEVAIARQQWHSLKGVKVVQSLYAGVDSFLQWLPKDVTLCDARGVHDIPIAEWVVGVMLAMQKYLPFYLELQQRADWNGREKAERIFLLSHPSDTSYSPAVLIDEVAETTVLIVGYGSIGKAIEDRLIPFGINILRVARTARAGVHPVSKLDELIGQADIVVLILPLTSETRNLIRAKQLAKMKPGALLINGGRGAVIDTNALLKALQERRIRAALDVTEPEPLPTGHSLWTAPNLLITPHVAGDSAKFMRRALKLASEQVERFARQEPLHNIVTGEY
jgi:phosphoglycerate dehydrogenase-like enzyme